MEKSFLSLKRNGPVLFSVLPKASTLDILRKLNLNASDETTLVCLDPEHAVNENKCASYFMVNGAYLTRDVDYDVVTHYLNDGRNNLFVIKEIDGREVSVDEKCVNDLKEAHWCQSLAYAEINGSRANITNILKGDYKCSIARLEERLQSCMKSEKYIEHGVDVLEKMIQKCIEFKEAKDKCSDATKVLANKKVKAEKGKSKKDMKSKKVKNADFSEEGDTNCFHNMDIDEDSI